MDCRFDGGILNFYSLICKRGSVNYNVIRNLIWTPLLAIFPEAMLGREHLKFKQTCRGFKKMYDLA